MTISEAKKIVLKKHPDAVCWRQYNDKRVWIVLLPNADYSIKNWQKHQLGIGKTKTLAWEKAAKRIKKADGVPRANRS